MDYDNDLYLDYNLDIKDSDLLYEDHFHFDNCCADFHTSCYKQPHNLSQDEFIENFMRIGGNSKTNDSTSTNSSLNLQVQDVYQFNSSGSLEKEVQNTFTKHKKGRPMTDTKVIVDDVTKKVYDPNVDPLEYKKARK